MEFETDEDIDIDKDIAPWGEGWSLCVRSGQNGVYKSNNDSNRHSGF